MKRALLLAVVGAFFLQLQQGGTRTSAQTIDGLKFFKNWFITGDYVVGGVGLRGQGVNGTASGEIDITGVPEDADIVGVFLYWQIVTKDTIGPDSGATGVVFNGYPLTAPDGPIGRVLDQAGTSPCWSSGGGTGSSGGVHRTYTYRVDAARFLNYDPETGKPIVNGAHTISLPDGGNGIPIALGASLVVLYRHSSLPLNAIVLYDDGFTVDNSNRTMFQTIKGFYQPSATPDARITYIVGSGQPNKNELVTFQGAALDPNPFGAYLGNSWDNYTAAVGLGSNPTTVSQVSTTIDTQGVSGSDCLSPAAIVFKTGVLDTDGDGLLDIWEQATTTPLMDPNEQPLPLLGTMGANPLRKDVFIEVGYMKHDGQDLDPDDPTAPRDEDGNVLPGKWVKYGIEWKKAHSHQPGHETIKMFGDAFWHAPVSNPDGSTGISVHIDAGASYPPGDPVDPKKNGDAYIIRGTGHERGGEMVEESATVCQRNPGVDPPWFCQFSDFPGTSGWKTGFRYIRDQVIGSNATPPQDPDTVDPCDAPGNDGPGEACERRFDRNRRAMFRYTFFGHFLGLPKSDKACLDEDGLPTGTNPETSLCDVAGNPDFHIPMTVSGVGDFPGADSMVTLGGFNDVNLKPVGTPFMQASTWAHEFGHTVYLRHGGAKEEPNCKPTYFSIMNYLYQLRGLLDNLGRPNLNFSGSVIAPTLFESPLSDNPYGELPYRLGWYAPKAGSYLELNGVPASRHCDGSPLLESDVPMVRIDAAFTYSPIDWRANNTPESNFALDINFNGRTTSTVGGTEPERLIGFNDWANMLLNQVGVRRNVGGLYYDAQGNVRYGPMSIDTGRVDLGRVDLGRVDLGRVDLGRVDLGRVDLGEGQAGRVDLGRVDLGDGDLGAGDMGRVDLGRVDLGRVDLGRVDLGRVDLGRGDDGRGDNGGGDRFVNDPNNPPGELDATTAGETNRSAPTVFAACVIGVDAGCMPASPLHAVSVSFEVPTSGTPGEYRVYRVDGDEFVIGQEWTLVGSPIPAVDGQERYSAVETSQLVNGAQYTFFAIAIYGDGVQSDPSNPVTITARNDPAEAGDDAYSTPEDTALVREAPGVLVNDADPDTPVVLTAVLVSGPAHGTVALAADGSFTYTPSANYNGADSFTYKATDGTVETNVATVDITVTPVNDVPSAANDSYETDEDTPLTVAAPGVLGNDSDIDGTLSAVLVSGPAQGALTLNADGSFTYTPPSNFNGAVSFTYRARDDGAADSNVATVGITVRAVNDAPVALADSYTVPQGTVLTVAAPGVLGNDSDLEGPLAAVLQSGPANGTLSLNANGSFTYTPAPTFFGTDAFTYRASDGAAFTAATVTITVRQLIYGFIGVQNLPAPGGKTYNVGSSVPLQWRFTVDSVVYNSVNAQPQIVIVSPTGQVIYTGTPADPGSSSFQPPTAANGYTWQFNWQTKNLAAGTYQVYVGSAQTGQTYANGSGFGPFAVTLKAK